MNRDHPTIGSNIRRKKALPNAADIHICIFHTWRRTPYKQPVCLSVHFARLQGLPLARLVVRMPPHSAHLIQFYAMAICAKTVIKTSTHGVPTRRINLDELY